MALGLNHNILSIAETNVAPVICMYQQSYSHQLALILKRNRNAKAPDKFSVFSCNLVRL